MIEIIYHIYQKWIWDANNKLLNVTRVRNSSEFMINSVIFFALYLRSAPSPFSRSKPHSCQSTLRRYIWGGRRDGSLLTNPNLELRDCSANDRTFA